MWLKLFSKYLSEFLINVMKLEFEKGLSKCRRKKLITFCLHSIKFFNPGHNILELWNVSVQFWFVKSKMERETW